MRWVTYAEGDSDRAGLVVAGQVWPLEPGTTLLDVLADKLQTASATAGETPGATAAGPPAAEHPARCTGCPICATLTYLADHRELSAQLAQGALLIVGAVRQYLDQSHFQS